MIQAWRIVKTGLAANAFDGEGARIHGGRWNSPGRPAVYASATRALATLEVLAGLGTTTLLPAYSLIRVSFDEALVEACDVSALPTGWDAHPPGDPSQSVGDAWLARGSSVVLCVPSALIRAEHNYVLNPLHPDFGAVEIGAPEAISFDRRLLAR